MKMHEDVSTRKVVLSQYFLHKLKRSIHLYDAHTHRVEVEDLPYNL